MDSKRAGELSATIMVLQSLMVAFATNGRTAEQPGAYRNMYAEVTLGIEDARYTNPNPHKSLEVFYAHCKLREMKTYASRRAYVEELYADILLDLKRIQRHAPTSRGWGKANEVLTDNLAPIRSQWLKAKNFIYAASPDYENSIKESISAVESCLMVLLNEPSGSLGKTIKQANLDSDIERIISQAYGFVSNKSFVRHGGTTESKLTKAEAEFFLEFSATSIVYITQKLKHKRHL